MYDLRDDQN